MARLIGALILSFTLAVPYLAEGACAWVLWVETSWTSRKTAETTNYWAVIGSRSTEDACGSEANRKINQLSAGSKTDPDDLEVKVFNNIISKRYGPEDNWRALSTDRVLCLPDTVDPRGPKR